ncbi:hypothetical protein [Desulforhopalus sp. 52FAK]
MNSIADIPINTHLGIKYDEVKQELSLPESESVMNLFGQVSYCAQFTLAEASSAQFLSDKLGLDLSTDIPTLRKTTTKFHKPTNGESICKLVSLEHTRDEFLELLAKKSKIMTSIEVVVLSEKGIKSLSASFQWLIIRNNL